MAKLEDLTGNKYGRLTVISRAENDNRGRARWTCQCECGNQSVVRTDSLKVGRINSCGCIQKEVTSAIFGTHKMSRTRIYKVWLGIKERCYNPHAKNYKNYGGRGITMCDRWKDSFENFYNDIGHQCVKGLSIDRIDVNGNYEPQNCRTATQKQQMNNTTRNVNLEYKGEIHNVAQWSQILGISRNTIYGRLRNGRRTEEALSK